MKSNTKTGILLTARLGSQRLKRKHLLPVNGNPIILYLIERILAEFDNEINAEEAIVVIATSTEKENREFEVFQKRGVHVFYGSNDNIPLRHLAAAKNFRFDSIISVDGDDILCSTYAMRKVYEALLNGFEYVRTVNLPLGMNAEGYQCGFLKNALARHSDEVLETGWDRIFDESKVYDISLDFNLQNRSLRFTLDYQEDYLFFKALIEDLKDNVNRADDRLIVEHVLKHNLHKLNESVNQKYWKNFHKLLDTERGSKSTMDNQSEE